MSEVLEVLERNGKEFVKIGEIVEKDNAVVLVGFDDYHMDFFTSEIAMGERNYTPKDGRKYIDAIKTIFAFSSMIVLRLKQDKVVKGGPGSGSWDAPGKPRFQWTPKERGNIREERLKIINRESGHPRGYAMLDGVQKKSD